MRTPIKYGKLVRDRIPEIIREDGWEPEVSILAEDELPAALCNKLLEEVSEFMSAPLHSSECLSELADILEVVNQLGWHLTGSTDALEHEAQAKRERRGGLTKGLYLVSIA